jgi:hypothetical protein
MNDLGNQIIKLLEEAYFEKLEEDCVDFVEWNDIGNGQMESLVKDEFIVSPREMCEYLEQPEWVIQWTLDLIKDEEERIK